MPLSEATKAVVLEALEFRKRKTLEFREFDPAMADEQIAAIDAAITEVKAASAAGEWRPVEDGCYEDVVVDDDGARLVIWVNQEHGDESVKLQPNIRLCEYIGSQEERDE